MLYNYILCSRRGFSLASVHLRKLLGGGRVRARSGSAAISNSPAGVFSKGVTNSSKTWREVFSSVCSSAISSAGMGIAFTLSSVTTTSEGTGVHGGSDLIVQLCPRQCVERHAFPPYDLLVEDVHHVAWLDFQRSRQENPSDAGRMEQAEPPIGEPRMINCATSSSVITRSM